MQSPKTPESSSPGDRWSAERLPSTLSAIVVEPNLTTALDIVSILTASQLHVTLTDCYLEARRRLNERPPDLIVTELKLGEYNGLGLVVRGKSLRPTMAAVVISPFRDVVLQSDTEAMGATFVESPVSATELRAAVFRTLFRVTDAQAPPIRPPFERRLQPRQGDELIALTDQRTADRRLRPQPDASVVFKSPAN